MSASSLPAIFFLPTKRDKRIAQQQWGAEWELMLRIISVQAGERLKQDVFLFHRKPKWLAGLAFHGKVLFKFHGIKSLKHHRVGSRHLEWKMTSLRARHRHLRQVERSTFRVRGCANPEARRSNILSRVIERVSHRNRHRVWGGDDELLMGSCSLFTEF